MIKKLDGKRLYYFSSTGNSLNIARDLAQELKDVDVISIAEVMNATNAINGDILGIIFPVYYYGVPLIVGDFIKKIQTAKYIFVVANYGDTPGTALIQVRDILKSQGLKLSAGFEIQMPQNYTPLYDVAPLEVQERMFRKKMGRLRIS